MSEPTSITDLREAFRRLIDAALSVSPALAVQPTTGETK